MIPGWEGGRGVGGMGGDEKLMMEMVVLVVGARNGGFWVAGDFYQCRMVD